MGEEERIKELESDVEVMTHEVTRLRQELKIANVETSDMRSMMFEVLRFAHHGDYSNGVLGSDGVTDEGDVKASRQFEMFEGMLKVRGLLQRFKDFSGMEGTTKVVPLHKIALTDGAEIVFLEPSTSEADGETGLTLFDGTKMVVQTKGLPRVNRFFLNHPDIDSRLVKSIYLNPPMPWDYNMADPVTLVVELYPASVFDRTFSEATPRDETKIMPPPGYVWRVVSDATGEVIGDVRTSEQLDYVMGKTDDPVSVRLVKDGAGTDVDHATETD